MCKFAYLAGGALVGAAGLATAAYLCKEDNSPQRRDAVDSLGPDALVGRLNTYVIKAHALSIKCSGVVMASMDLQSTPIDLPGDTLLTRLGNMLGGKMTVASRGWKHNALRDLKKEAEHLYTQHHGLFARANELLERYGMGRISCREVSFDQKNFSLNNELSNEDWILELNALADGIRNFLEASTVVAEQLISNLEGIQKHDTADGGKTPAIASA